MACPVSSSYTPSVPTNTDVREGRVNVLIADDCMMTHTLMNGLIRRIFEQREVPVEVVGVPNGANARAALCESEFYALSPTNKSLRHHMPCNFDLVLMDQQFPEREGTPAIPNEGQRVTQDVRNYEIACQTKTGKRKHVKIVAHSASDDQYAFTPDNGFDGTIKKASPRAMFEELLQKLRAFDLPAPAASEETPGGEAGPSE